MKQNIFYVSPIGADENPGTAEAPFRTVAQAQKMARLAESPVTVEVAAGIYREKLYFDQQDDGDTYQANGEVILTGGVIVPYAETEPLTDETICAALTPEAAVHVRVIDLQKLHVEPDAYGKLFAVGAYHTQGRYDGESTGTNIEVFDNDHRMVLAQYPNDGKEYLKLDGVDQICDIPDHRNPFGGRYIMDEETTARVRRWRFPETAWTFAYFGFDWADGSTPVAFELENRILLPKFASYYTAGKGNQYYLYNILDELDVPGEYFLDREKGLLYVYPEEAGKNFEISLSTGSLVHISNTQDFTFAGFTLTCIRGTAVTGGGNKRLTLDGLTVKNAADHGIVLTGTEITVKNCEVMYTGRGGIHLTGGDRETLTSGQNRIINNCVHDFAQVYRTYQAGILMHGVGCYCAHNELYNSPHAALSYGGNLHLLEYNYVHHVVQHSHDAGALYSGGDPIGHGTVVRYNLFRNIGNEKFHPDGIYWDDGLSGQTAYGNILIDVGRFSIISGGGRDNTIRDNIIIGECWDAIHYDDRFRAGFLQNGEKDNLTGTLDKPFWGTLKVCPYQGETWVSHFPTLAKLSSDLSDPENPYFALNPGGSLVENNIIINSERRLGAIDEAVYRFSTVGNNPIYATTDEADFDMDTLHFRHPREGFPEIPSEKIGRLPERA